MIVPRALRANLITSFTYNTRQAEQGQIRLAETIRGRGRTKITERTFKYQASVLYNEIPARLRQMKPENMRKPLKKWIKENIPLR